eukprot:758648-Hanusia_phi.AAC.1
MTRSEHFTPAFQDVSLRGLMGQVCVRNYDRSSTGQESSPLSCGIGAIILPTTVPYAARPKRGRGRIMDCSDRRTLALPASPAPAA